MWTAGFQPAIMRSMRYSFPALFLAAKLLAAEPVVTPDDLPRVPPTPPEKAAATCAVRPGFRVELMAAEPLVVDPVAMAFDEDGRLFVVEMRDYSERRDERLGRVKLLEDTDGDGRIDRATIFADGLPWPTGIACWDGGIFVLASPELLYFKDMDGDGKADVHQLIFTGFGSLAEKLNVQQLPNSLQWGPDQRIHGALGGNAGLVQNFARFGSPKIELRGRDFSFDPRAMDLRAESGGGQFGMTFDETGRKFVCSNSRHLMQVMYEDRIAARVSDFPLPAQAIDTPPMGRRPRSSASAPTSRGACFARNGASSARCLARWKAAVARAAILQARRASRCISVMRGRRSSGAMCSSRTAGAISFIAKN